MVQMAELPKRVPWRLPSKNCKRMPVVVRLANPLKVAGSIVLSVAIFVVHDKTKRRAMERLANNPVNVFDNSLTADEKHAQVLVASRSGCLLKLLPLEESLLADWMGQHAVKRIDVAI